MEARRHHPVLHPPAVMRGTRTPRLPSPAEVHGDLWPRPRFLARAGRTPRRPRSLSRRQALHREHRARGPGARVPPLPPCSSRIGSSPSVRVVWSDAWLCWIGSGEEDESFVLSEVAEVDLVQSEQWKAGGQTARRDPHVVDRPWSTAEFRPRCKAAPNGGRLLGRMAVRRASGSTYGARRVVVVPRIAARPTFPARPR